MYLTRLGLSAFDDPEAFVWDRDDRSPDPAEEGWHLGSPTKFRTPEWTTR